MPVVSTGQITIVDTNDARPLTGFITANPAAQQAVLVEDAVAVYTPDWTTVNSNTGLVLTAKVFVGTTTGVDDITSQLTNTRWSLDGTTQITGTAALISANAAMAAAFVSGAGKTFTAAASTFTIKSNFLTTVNSVTLYFDADYMDSVSGLTSHIQTSIALGAVELGSNVVLVQIHGALSIQEAHSTTKNVGVACARVVRSAGFDDTGITYRFYEANGGTQIIAAGNSTKYGLKATATGVAPTGANANIGQNLPAANGDWSTYNTLVIHESAVTDMEVYRVEVKDAANTIFQTYFTVYDVSDPYDTQIASSAGVKLQNGVGTTLLTPSVTNTGVAVDISSWTFTWTFYNRNGKRGAFVDAARTNVTGGRTISAHTTGASATFTHSGSAFTVNAGDIIKCVTPTGDEYFYEVVSAAGSVITTRAANTHASWLSSADFPYATTGQFTNGKLFMCRGYNTLGQVTTSGSAALTITGDDIDAKGIIFCDSNRP
jgi:hypothetical protein